MPSNIQRAADLLRQSAYTVALTGAGLSTPSGIPDFRSPNAGLWTLVDPMEIASIWAFHERPNAFYDWIRPLMKTMAGARPNGAHRVLAQMEERGRLQAIITQNIDSLHQLAGSKRVLELHGHTRSAVCLTCGAEVSSRTLLPEVLAGGPVPHCECGGLLKPNAVLFGEPLPYEAIIAAQQEALACEVMLVIGTSLEVMPAGDLPWLAQRRGAKVILINRQPTLADKQADIVVRADVVDGLQELWQSAGL